MVIALDNVNKIPANLLGPIALTVHRIVGNMPVAIKCRGGPGILVADGTIINGALECRELDRAFERRNVTRVRLDNGTYPGKEMYASPIEHGGKAFCAIGVIDTSGTLALKEFAEAYTALNNQVSGDRPVK
jgi:hypothetical protein